MSEITAHELEAELLSAEDVDKDIVSFTRVLAQKKAEKLIQTVLMREDIRQLFDKLLSVGVFRDEEEIITRALQTLFVAVSPHAKVAMHRILGCDEIYRSQDNTLNFLLGRRNEDPD